MPTCNLGQPETHSDLTGSSTERSKQALHNQCVNHEMYRFPVLADAESRINNPPITVDGSSEVSEHGSLDP
jgi:hypothetical protein